MTLLEVETGNRLDYRGFPRRAALADRSAAFWDTTGYLAWSGPPVGTRSLLASSEAALLDRLMDFGSGGRADARPAV